MNMKIKLCDIRLLNMPPKPESTGAAGIDLRACLPNSKVAIPKGQVLIVDTGIKVAIPKGFVGLVNVRSSIGLKGVNLANGTGVIDSDYRGNIKLALINRNDAAFHVDAMDRIAQLIVVPHYKYTDVQIVDELDITERGDGGFGSTGAY